MKQSILVLSAMITLSLPTPSTAINEEITSLIVGTAGLASLVATLFAQPDYTEMTKNATSQEELDKINVCAQNHARDIAMLKEELKECSMPANYLIYKYHIEHPDENILWAKNNLFRRFAEFVINHNS